MINSVAIAFAIADETKKGSYLVEKQKDKIVFPKIIVRAGENIVTPDIYVRIPEIVKQQFGINVKQEDLNYLGAETKLIGQTYVKILLCTLNVNPPEIQRKDHLKFTNKFDDKFKDHDLLEKVLTYQSTLSTNENVKQLKTRNRI